MQRVARSPSSDSEDDTILHTPPTTPKKRPAHPNTPNLPSTPTPIREPRAFISSNCPLNTPPRTPKKSKTNNITQSPDFTASPGIWTADKREAIIERLIALGLKSTNIDSLALEFTMSKLQIKNSVQAGRAGNLRDKACKAVRGD